MDGTLLTPAKLLTERAVRAVQELRNAHVEVALTIDDRREVFGC